MRPLAWEVTNYGRGGPVHSAVPVTGCMVEVYQPIGGGRWNGAITTPFRKSHFATRRVNVEAAKRVATKQIAKALVRAQSDAMALADEIARALWPRMPTEVFLHSAKLPPLPTFPGPGVRAVVVRKGGGK